VWEQQVGRTNATFPGIGRGNGYLIPILGKTEVAYEGRVAAGVFQDVPIAVGVDSSEFVSGLLLAKLHTKNTWSASGVLRILAQNIMLVPEEPDVVYLSTATAVAEVTFSNSDVAPALKLTPFTGVIGPMLRILLRWDQGATAWTGTQTASISIDLVGRPA
jgi:hypothetical protein